MHVASTGLQKLKHCLEKSSNELQGAESARCSILTHPLEEVQALSAEFTTDVSASWQGERVIWSSPELPYLATYSKVTIKA
jgi:hypothetical protein